MFKYIVVGAGLAGITIAERIANELNEQVLIIEKRGHIGGNVYDCYDEHGILIHKYGPHIFHTNNKKIWDYLSQFTAWKEYQHKVLGYVDGQLIPIPFNLNTIDKLFPAGMAARYTNKLIQTFGYGIKVPILELNKTEDVELRQLAQYVYEKVFLNYTTKQWDVSPDKVDGAVTARVPIHISRDDRYFQNTYQGMPLLGYTKMVENILNSNKIKIMLKTDFKEISQFNKNKIEIFEKTFNGKIVYTGNVDELFDYTFGELGYRSTKFDFEYIQEQHHQSVATVNYPNNYDFTRITEFKHMTGQKNTYGTTILREYPQKYDRNIVGRDVPMYPVLDDSNQQIYNKYKQEAEKYNNIIFAGRLAEYMYYDMDAVIAKALDTFKKLCRQ
ncbi:UDP-galactopyranose mutase [Sporomusa sphaeroides]|uniref:UDP-galactopyranose mutase n=1 Tax=Sporomusa sphaeroides TaxID=47679 RepID=UPI002BA1602E|nr:UDP-galactopyranose mutase [Sporomusa sphaeroides]HML34145.1 UDP-galactopyranose mutase [Sporomusa sphaeroides]